LERAGFVQPYLNGGQPTLVQDYTRHLKANGKAEETINRAKRALTQLSRQCKITNPYEVKEAIANFKWKNSTKQTVADHFTGFFKYIGKAWERPRYTQEKTLPLIPTETEIDQLIASSNKRYATYLQILKETGIRTDELMKTLFSDIDAERKTINIKPSKGSNPRILPLSTKLIDMINQLPHKSLSICPMKKHTFRTNFEASRNRTAKKLNNPRIKQIHLHTFRHWKGTMEYHKTRDVIHVKHVLGHKSIESTMIYINIEQSIFTNMTNEYYSATAKTIQEAQKLIETGFEYVTEIDGTKLFRKRK
jgi:integrase/recombinase XerD